MPNPLTGDFDALIQVSEGTVNRLLASLHQHEPGGSEAPSLPHKAVIRIDDDPVFGGAPAGVRGVAYVQVGVPMVSVVPGVTQADVSMWVRSWYRPDPGTTVLPEFVHAKVTVRVGVVFEHTPGGLAARVTLPEDDSAVVLTEHGLLPADAGLVATVVRWFIRNRLDAALPLGDALPDGVGAPLTVIDAQGRRAIALPVSLTGGTPTGKAGDVFLDSSDFAIGVSAGFILSLLQPALDAVKSLQATFTIEVLGQGVATYTLKINAANAFWQPDGRIRIAVDGKATTGAVWAPNVSFAVSEDFKIVVHFPALSDGFVVSVEPVGGISVSADAGGPFAGMAESAAKDKAKEQFARARDQALAQLQPLINEIAARTQLLRKVFSRFDPQATVEYQKYAPGPDGLVIRGRVGVSPRKTPRIEFTELGHGSGYTAFNTWVPGGRVKRYTWYWWRSDYPTSAVFGGPEVRTKILHDRFVLQEPDLPLLPWAATPPSSSPSPGTGPVTPDFPPGTEVQKPAPPVWAQVCLFVHGEYVDPVSGSPVGITEEAWLSPHLACTFAGPEIPLHSVDISKVIWLIDPEPPSDYSPILHVDLWSPREQPSSLPVLLLQTGSDPATELTLLHDALRSPGEQPMRLVVILSGRSEGPTRRELAETAARIGRDRTGVTILFADGNRAASGDRPLAGRPQAQLLGADGRVLWQSDDRLSARTLAAALREHADALAARPSGLRLLRASVRPGERAPDFAIETASGARMRFRRLRGRPVRIVFAPPEPEVFSQVLARTMPRSTDAGAVLTVVVLDDRRDLDAATRVFGAGSLFVPDRDRAIARAYGIRARPTIVHVDYDGRVSAVQIVSGIMAAAAVS